MRPDLSELAALPLIRERISARARNLRIEIRPDGEVLLVIPRRASRAEAYAFVAERAEWIRRERAKLRAMPRPPPRVMAWDGSDRLPLRGAELRVRAIPAHLPRIAVRFDSTSIDVWCPSAQLSRHETLNQALRGALRREARRDATRMLAEEARRLGVSYQGPRIAEQKSLWGSCTSDGLISLNWRLVLAPPEVFRYVVVHELCHRRHHNHSQRFWNLVARQMTDFAAHRDWLRRYGQRLYLPLPPQRGVEQLSLPL